MYLAQYDFIPTEVEKLEKHEKWLNTNLKDAGKYILVQDYYDHITWYERGADWNSEENYELRKTSYYEVIDALSEMLKIEKEEEIVLLTKAWQNRILDEFYYEYGLDFDQLLPYESTYNQNEKELRKSPNLYKVLQYQKFGPIVHLTGARRNELLGVGLSVGMGSINRINKIRTMEYSVGLAYNHYFNNNTYGEYYLDFTFSKFGWIELRLGPSLLTDYKSTVGMGFLPSAGLRIWDFYNFARKSKFEELRGHSLGLSYSFMFLQDRSFWKKNDGYEL